MADTSDGGWSSLDVAVREHKKLKNAYREAERFGFAPEVLQDIYQRYSAARSLVDKIRGETSVSQPRPLVYTRGLDASTSSIASTASSHAFRAARAAAPASVRAAGGEEAKLQAERRALREQIRLETARDDSPFNMTLVRLHERYDYVKAALIELDRAISEGERSLVIGKRGTALEHSGNYEYDDPDPHRRRHAAMLPVPGSTPPLPWAGSASAGNGRTTPGTPTTFPEWAFGEASVADTTRRDGASGESSTSSDDTEATAGMRARTGTAGTPPLSAIRTASSPQSVGRTRGSSDASVYGRPSAGLLLLNRQASGSEVGLRRDSDVDTTDGTEEGDISHAYNIVFLGSSGAGKTGIIQRFMSTTSFEHTVPTLGHGDVCSRPVEIMDKQVELVIHDCSGSDDYLSFFHGVASRSLTLLRADFFVFVYSVASRESFDDLIARWKKVADRVRGPKCKAVLVGARSDDETRRKVRMEEGKILADRYGWVFFECSAATNANVAAIFNQLERYIMDDLTQKQDKRRLARRIARHKQLRRRQQSLASFGDSSVGSFESARAPRESLKGGGTTGDLRIGSAPRNLPPHMRQELGGDMGRRNASAPSLQAAVEDESMSRRLGSRTRAPMSNRASSILYSPTEAAKLKSALASSRSGPLSPGSPRNSGIFAAPSASIVLEPAASSTSYPLIKAGTVDALIDELVSPKRAGDCEYQHAFLLTYRSFVTPMALLQGLAARYDLEAHDDADERLWGKELQLIRERIVAVLQKFLDSNMADVLDNHGEFLEELIVFMDRVADDPGPLPARADLNLAEIVKREVLGQVALIAPPLPAPAPLLPADTHIAQIERGLKRLPPVEIARQLTLIESKLFAAVRAAECLNVNKKEDGASPFAAMTEHFNMFSEWAVMQILAKSKVSSRARILGILIDVAVECRELNNFNGVLELCCAFARQPVYRLYKTWGALSKKHKAAYAKLQQEISPSHNFKVMRTALANASLPCIPYSGIYSKDLTFIEEGNKNTTPEGLVFFAKRRLLATVIGQIQHFQKVPYCFTAVPALQAWLQRPPPVPFDEDKLLEVSSDPIRFFVFSCHCNENLVNVDKPLRWYEGTMDLVSIKPKSGTSFFPCLVDRYPARTERTGNRLHPRTPDPFPHYETALQGFVRQGSMAGPQRLRVQLGEREEAFEIVPATLSDAVAMIASAIGIPPDQIDVFWRMPSGRRVLMETQDDWAGTLVEAGDEVRLTLRTRAPEPFQAPPQHPRAEKVAAFVPPSFLPQPQPVGRQTARPPARPPPDYAMRPPVTHYDEPLPYDDPTPHRPMYGAEYPPPFRNTAPPPPQAGYGRYQQQQQQQQSAYGARGDFPPEWATFMHAAAAYQRDYEEDMMHERERARAAARPPARPQVPVNPLEGIDMRLPSTLRLVYSDFIANLIHKNRHDIEAQSGSRISISSDISGPPLGEWTRVVVIDGTLATNSAAQSLIHDLITQRSGENHAEATSLHMLVPNQITGAVIGKKATVLSAFKARSGARVELMRDHEVPPGVEFRMATLYGTPRQLRLCQILISEHMERLMNWNATKGLHESMSVASEHVRFVVGKKGAIIQTIIRQSGAQVEVERDSHDGRQDIKIFGPPEAVAQAKKLIGDVLAFAYSKTDAAKAAIITESMEVFCRDVTPFRNAYHFALLERDLEVQIRSHVDEVAKILRFDITGAAEDVSRAKGIISTAVEKINSHIPGASSESLSASAVTGTGPALTTSPSQGSLQSSGSASSLRSSPSTHGGSTPLATLRSPLVPPGPLRSTPLQTALSPLVPTPIRSGPATRSPPGAAGGNGELPSPPTPTAGGGVQLPGPPGPLRTPPTPTAQQNVQVGRTPPTPSGTGTTPPPVAHQLDRSTGSLPLPVTSVSAGVPSRSNSRQGTEKGSVPSLSRQSSGHENPAMKSLGQQEAFLPLPASPSMRMRTHSSNSEQDLSGNEEGGESSSERRPRSSSVRSGGSSNSERLSRRSSHSSESGLWSAAQGLDGIDLNTASTLRLVVADTDLDTILGEVEAVDNMGSRMALATELGALPISDRQRVVNVEGTLQSNSLAQQHIFDLIHEGEDMGPQMLSMLVPNSVTARIIGKKGAVLNGIMKRCGARSINLTPDNDMKPGMEHRKAEVHGTVEQIRVAQVLLSERIQRVTQPDVIIHDALAVPSDRIGLLIGREGSTIKRIMHESGATVEVSMEKMDSSQAVKISGPSQAVQTAKQLIRDMLARKDPAPHSAVVEEMFWVPTPHCRAIATQPAVLRSIEQQSGAQLEIAREYNRGSQAIRMTGSRDAVSAANSMLAAALDKLTLGPQHPLFERPSALPAFFQGQPDDDVPGWGDCSYDDAQLEVLDRPDAPSMPALDASASELWR